MIEVNTQAALDKALTSAKPTDIIACIGNGYFTVRESAHVVARESAHVEAWESAHVVAWESAHVVAWGSAHVVAWGSAHVVAWESAHVEAWGSAHVEAWGSAHVVARESAHVVAGKYVSVHRLSKLSRVEGGVVIEPPEIETAEDWCDFYGVPVVDGVAVLYKAVREDFGSNYMATFKYTPGTTPEAPDWDPVPECGNGLHFAPTPYMAATYLDNGPPKYIACPVRLEDIVVHKNARYPNKVKARRVALPCWEVDLYGKELAVPA